MLCCSLTDAGVLPTGPAHRKVVVNLENACSALCTNHVGNLLAVVGRKGEQTRREEGEERERECVWWGVAVVGCRQTFVVY